MFASTQSIWQDVSEQATHDYNFLNEKNRLLLAPCWYHQDRTINHPVDELKGQCHEIFLVQVVFMNHLPKAPGVVDTCGKFAIDVDDTGGKSPEWRSKKAI